MDYSASRTRDILTLGGFLLAITMIAIIVVRGTGDTGPSNNPSIFTLAPSPSTASDPATGATPSPSPSPSAGDVAVQPAAPTPGPAIVNPNPSPKLQPTAPRPTPKAPPAPPPTPQPTPIDNPPTAILNATPVGGGSPLHVTASAALSWDSDATGIVSYQFNWGDGLSTAPQASATASHIYNVSGSYTLTVIVVDRAGLWSTASTTIKVI